MGNLIDSSDAGSPTGLVAETTCVQNAAMCQDWWSSGLNVNPYEVDETHGAAAYVDFTVPDWADVNCVKVVSRSLGPGQVPRQYYPTEMVLYRGWKYNDRKEGELVASPTHLDG